MKHWMRMTALASVSGPWMGACAVDTTPSALQEARIDATGAIVAGLLSNLPACNRTRANAVYYVIDTEQFYVCNGHAYQELDLAGLDGADGANGADGRDGADGADGRDGADGARGADGAPGATSLVRLDEELAGAHCAFGGTRISSGVDADGSGELDPGEVADTSYACHGEAGTTIACDVDSYRFLAPNLQGCELAGVDLRGANLRGADLSGADLSRALLTNVDFVGANLTGASLEGTYPAEVRAYDLIGCPAVVPDEWSCLPQPDGGYMLLGPYANLSYTRLSGADLAGVDLNWANLYRADLSGADLTGTKLGAANLFSTNLAGANLSGANLQFADFDGANLAGADMTGADLTYASRLSTADLSGVTWSATICPNRVLSDHNGGRCP